MRETNISICVPGVRVDELPGADTLPGAATDILNILLSSQDYRPLSLTITNKKKRS